MNRSAGDAIAWWRVFRAVVCAAWTLQVDMVAGGEPTRGSNCTVVRRRVVGRHCQLHDNCNIATQTGEVVMTSEPSEVATMLAHWRNLSWRSGTVATVCLRKPCGTVHRNVMTRLERTAIATRRVCWQSERPPLQLLSLAWLQCFPPASSARTHAPAAHSW
jgi:hypothetical protein